jgi:hypothetical protein
MWRKYVAFPDGSLGHQETITVKPVGRKTGEANSQWQMADGIESIKVTIGGTATRVLQEKPSGMTSGICVKGRKQVQGDAVARFPVGIASWAFIAFVIPSFLLPLTYLSSFQ